MIDSLIGVAFRQFLQLVEQAELLIAFLCPFQADLLIGNFGLLFREWRRRHVSSAAAGP